jgi:hypothetical protein
VDAWLAAEEGQQSGFLKSAVCLLRLQDTLSVSNGGNRLATILIYLAEPEFGGETGKRLLLLTCCADLDVCVGEHES